MGEWVMVMVMVVKDTRYHRACQTGRFVTCLPQKTSYKMEKLDDKAHDFSDKFHFHEFHGGRIISQEIRNRHDSTSIDFAGSDRSL